MVTAPVLMHSLREIADSQPRSNTGEVKVNVPSEFSRSRCNPEQGIANVAPQHPKLLCSQSECLRYESGLLDLQCWWASIKLHFRRCSKGRVDGKKHSL